MESRGGYKLPELREGLRQLRFDLHYFPRLRSTNDQAAAMRRAGRIFAPCVVLTPDQTAGRGRGGNTWFSSAGVMTVTFVLPVEETMSPHQLPLLAGLAIRNAAADIAGGASIGLKWPNDLYHDNRKLAGLLCERVDDVDLVGLGLNVNLDPADAPEPLNARITSLGAISRTDLDMTGSLLAVTQHLSQMTARRQDTPFAVLLREYEQHHVLRGRRIAVHVSPDQPPVVGACEGLDDTGRLLVRSAGGRHALIAGHVQAL